MSIKMSLEQANELLQKMGVEAVVVAEDSEADQNLDIGTMAKAVFNESAARIRQDVELELKEDARSAEAGKHLNSTRVALKRLFGLKEDEMKDLNLSDMLKKAKESITANKSDADNDYLKRYEALLAEQADKESAFEQALAAKDAEWNEKFTDKDINERLLNVITGIPTIGGDKSKHAMAMKRELKENYIVKFNPTTKEVELYDKENPERKVFDGNNVISDKYYAEKYLKEMGVHAPDTRHLVPKDVLDGRDKTVKSGVAQLAPTDAMAFLEESMKQ